MAARIIQTKAGPYRMTYRPDPISRLAKYQHKPPPMVGNPADTGNNWDEYCRIVYQANIDAKRGNYFVPKWRQRGVWYYLDPP